MPRRKNSVAFAGALKKKNGGTRCPCRVQTPAQASPFCQLHISVYKLSPSALQCHVGVVSSVCFYFAILLRRALLNTREQALIRDQPPLKDSIITAEGREEPRNYCSPKLKVGYLHLASWLCGGGTRSVVGANKRCQSLPEHEKEKRKKKKRLVVVRLVLRSFIHSVVRASRIIFKGTCTCEHAFCILLVISLPRWC